MPAKDVIPTGRRQGRGSSSPAPAEEDADLPLRNFLRSKTTARRDSSGYTFYEPNLKTGKAARNVAAASLSGSRSYGVVKVGGKREDFIVGSKDVAVALLYGGRPSIDDFARVVNVAPPMQLLETERQGVEAAFLGDMAERMDVSFSHLAESVGIPKATAARKLAKNEMIDGAAAIALARLLAIANEIVEDSTAPEAKKFDTAKWLGQWIERPQPALGGRKPSELLDTPTGVSMVTKVLGAIRSGAYQ